MGIILLLFMKIHTIDGSSMNMKVRPLALAIEESLCNLTLYDIRKFVIISFPGVICSVL